MRRLAAALAAVAALVAVSPAGAHEERALEALTVLDSVTPDVPGVEFWVDHLTAPVLVARNGTSTWLVVYGDDAEPFLRIKKGSVQLNASSPTAYRSLFPEGVAPAEIKTRGPRWVSLARGSTWSWFDSRIAYMPGGSGWLVTARHGHETIVIEGGFEPLASHGHFTTELDARPAIPGFEIRLLPGPIPGFFVRNDTQQVLRVPGVHGEPFLRIGPHGVWANLASPTYYLGGAQTIMRPPPEVGPGSAPRWKHVSANPSWAWLELRARLSQDLRQRSELGADPRTIHSWTTPLRLGPRSVSVGGRTRWIPPRTPAAVGSSGAFQRALLAAGATALTTGAFVAVRRRTRLASYRA